MQETKDKVRLTAVKEVSHLTIHVPEGQSEGPGSSVTYYSDLLDADGTKIGTTVDGFGLVFIDPADARLKEVVQATDTFADGTVFWTGVVDIAAISQGEPQSATAFGATGRYRGMVGTRTIRMVARETPTTSVFSMDLELDE
jgi:hypothetical protein